jgi:hypothetical protein
MMIMDPLTALASAVQDHIPVQPSESAGGASPAPVKITFTGGRWLVHFVKAVTIKGTKRKWDIVAGPTLELALLAARAAQTAARR